MGGSLFLHFVLGCIHLPENSILFAKRQFAAQFPKCSNSLNFEAKINCNTPRQNVLKWRKTCTGLKFDLVHFNGPQTKFICDSLHKHPVDIWSEIEWMVYGKYSANKIFTIFRVATTKYFFTLQILLRHYAISTSDYTTQLTDCNWLIHQRGAVRIFANQTAY